MLNSPDNPMVQNISYVVGNDKRIQFWSDIWVGESALMRSFPRIFALACQKRGTIADFGRVVDDAVWSSIWSNLVPPSVEAFLWKAVHGRFPTKVNLHNRGCLYQASLMCPMCGSFPEMTCYVRQLWGNRHWRMLKGVDSNCMITFSKSVGVTDCTSAELLAIKEA
ncbi:hypothetical protein V6N12_056514 [Hibiscus sabdariffa]|uniref:Reverse transcriptase zinc-binding domain-containing protein n=1 Tax=Hibiscus sabdariffa TaxID=183260 RepID=A0ABR2CSR5_9ROSI